MVTGALRNDHSWKILDVCIERVEKGGSYVAYSIVLPLYINYM